MPANKKEKNKLSNIILSVIIPVRNEGLNIKILLKILMSILEVSHEILIIYDSPDDDSIPIVKLIKRKYCQVKLVHNELGKGVANAILSGINVSKGEYILIFAADEIGPVLAIEDMIMLMEKGCDLVSCTRYAYGGRRLGGSITQAILSKIGNRLFKIIVGTSLTDSTTGIKMVKRHVFSEVTLESREGWAVLFELAIKTQLLGKKMGEVPIISIDRLYGGKSSFKIKRCLKEYMKWFFYGIRHLRVSSKKGKILIRIPQNTV